MLGIPPIIGATGVHRCRCSASRAKLRRISSQRAPTLNTEHSSPLVATTTAMVSRLAYRMSGESLNSLQVRTDSSFATVWERPC